MGCGVTWWYGLSMPCLSDLVVWIIHAVFKRLGGMDYPWRV